MIENDLIPERLGDIAEFDIRQQLWIVSHGNGNSEDHSTQTKSTLSKPGGAGSAENVATGPGGFQDDEATCRRSIAGSAFHICKLGGNSSITHRENVHSAQMPGLSIAHLAIDPGNGGAVSANDHFFGFKVRVGVAGE